MPTPSDTELIGLARGGDTDAFGTWMRRHQQRIFRLALHMLRNPTEAQDITQEAFVRAYQCLERFQGESQPYTGLYRITVNLCLNTIRKHSHRRHVAAEDPRIDAWMAQFTSAQANPENLRDQKEVARLLCDAVDQLNETLRTTLLLVCVEGQTHGEAAQVLGCKEGTIAWRVHEARRLIREYLQQRGWMCEQVQS